MNRPDEDRRRYGRVRLDTPLRAEFGDARVAIYEISVVGFLVAHEKRFAQGETHHLILDWNGERIDLVCSLIRSTLWRLAKNIGERSVYHSGLQIVETMGDSYARLRELIAERIIRALEEMKANARGIPPLAAYMYQPGKGELYRRCEFVAGEWRKTETIRATQPSNGFTISADVEDREVELLCRTWEAMSAEGRRLTQTLAELSIDKKEGIPVRRYEP